MSDESETRPNSNGGMLVTVLSLAALVLGGIILVFSWDGFDAGESDLPLAQGGIPAAYDADRAYEYLVQLCRLGPRPSGSAAMKSQQELLTKHFSDLGGTVRLQATEIRHPETGVPVEINNLIASWHPDRPKRFLVCAHYDTRPFPDRDRKNPKGRFVGANDGGSGVAGLMELAHHLSSLPRDVGVDLVCFDAEEFVFDEDRDRYFLGSIYFAQQYKLSPPQIPYQGGILLDMVADKELRLYFERNSLRYAKDITRGIWKVASDLHVNAFVPRARHEIRDDHLPLNQIAGIPTTDLIDFDYPRPGLGAPKYWHTENDKPENCSGESLAVVVWVVHQWLLRQ